MDFSQIGPATSPQVSIDPRKIFYSLPSLENTPNDLWSGQSSALIDWHEHRKRNDVLVSLNTGAGKTIVGSLIAQSLVNEGLENVLYVCSTIDLVKQTAKECDSLGIKYSVRTRGQFNNTLFEAGNGFCITTYTALFNGYSALRRRYFPQAIIFDDAHVAESTLRDAFTLKINRADHRDLFDEIATLFEPHFKELDVSGKFRDSLTNEHHSTCMAAPRGLYQRIDQLLQILRKYNIKNDDDLKYSFVHLEDHIKACAAIFSRGCFELSPPFLPSLAFDIFERSIRRVYLSATLQSQTDFIRAFGRLPDYSVEPNNDAGNGERLVINGMGVEGDFSQEYIKLLSEKIKTIVAVPSYSLAEQNWSNVGTPPIKENFSSELEAFRQADRGAFILVSRVDGIDLPHDTCRIMVLEGVPTGTSLLERYQWEFLRMNNVQSVRVANRLAQLFGRINRGRKDYGIFLIQGRELNTWLRKDKHIALLPTLLQKQILLGRRVQEGMDIKDYSKVNELMTSVLSRDQSWLTYYEQEVKLGELDQEQLNRFSENEPFMVKAALSEAKYAAAVWNGDYCKARRALEDTIDATTKADTPLGGWQAVWLAAMFDLDGDEETAETFYGIARSRLGSAITLPRKRQKASEDGKALVCNDFYRQISSYLDYTHTDKYNAEILKLKNEFNFIEEGSPRQAEAGVRKLGELLGFQSIRPDNDDGTGPDVLWLDNNENLALGFELKTDKKSASPIYYKNDISQGHDHISWVQSKYPDHKLLRLLFVGPEGKVDHKANPTELMGICHTNSIIELGNKILALLSDYRRYTPRQRIPALTPESKKAEWELPSLADNLCNFHMNYAIFT